jgi:mono/diheme cytochrome c family protein
MMRSHPAYQPPRVVGDPPSIQRRWPYEEPSRCPVKPQQVWMIAVLIVIALSAVRSTGQTPASDNESRIREITTGKHLFASNCSNSFCHGSDGGPGRGPRLRDRDWDKSYLYRTIEEGVPGSPMPSWKGRLTERQISALVLYILSLSREAPANINTQHAALDTSTTVTNVAKHDTAARGRELFFDLSNERNCGICHRVRDAGSSVGPALDTLSNNSPSEILASIQEPNAKSALEIRTTSGETICGIKAGGDSTSLRLYDLPSAGPPVLRTFPLQEIAQRGSCSNLKVHADFAHLFTRQQLSDIVAFLKSAE